MGAHVRSVVERVDARGWVEGVVNRSWSRRGCGCTALGLERGEA